MDPVKKCHWCEATLAVGEDGQLIDDAFIIEREDGDDIVYCSFDCMFSDL